MRPTDRFEGLAVFLAVAQRRSFRAAAIDLGVTAGAVSQAIRALETRLGVALFLRTTRHVSLTEAGAALHERVLPASDAIGAAMVALDDLRVRPAGLLRLTVPRMAVPLFITPVLPRLRERYPEITVEVSVEDALLDIMQGGFDAGIRMGEAVSGDMIAAWLSPEVRWCVVGAPGYFAAHGHPKSPHDLRNHTSIRYRYPRSGAVYRWELMDDGVEIAIDVSGPITVDDGDLALALARCGLGLTYAADALIANDLARGALVKTLEAHAVRAPGFCLYFPASAQHQPKLRAFIEVARSVLAGASTA